MGNFLDVLEVRRRQLSFASATLLARLREIGEMEYLQPFSLVLVMRGYIFNLSHSSWLGKMIGCICFISL